VSGYLLMAAPLLRIAFGPRPFHLEWCDVDAWMVLYRPVLAATMSSDFAHRTATKWFSLWQADRQLQWVATLYVVERAAAVP
jgi:hypothetical protein